MSSQAALYFGVVSASAAILLVAASESQHKHGMRRGLYTVLHEQACYIAAVLCIPPLTA